MSSTTWDDVIGNSDSGRFVGRKTELSIFMDDISKPSPSYLIYFIYGQGGVGKSELQKHYKEIAEKRNIIIADCDERQGNIPLILYRFANQIKLKGYSLDKFFDKYHKFQQLKQEIESDPDAPFGLASFLGQSIARVGLSLAEEVPVLRQGIKLIDQESVSSQAGEWAKYLTKKWSNKHDEIALIKDPIPVLSSLFFDELNDAAYDNRIILCFDNYEITRDYLDAWLIQIREYNPSTNIRLIISCRTSPGSAWESLNNVLKQIPLDVFSQEEANKFLDLAGIKNKQRREEILEFSGHLPVLMRWLSSPNSDNPDPVIPTAEIVDRFLRWVIDPKLRITAVELSVPRFFNIDILSLIFNNENPSNVDSQFEWLRKQPFIKQHNLGWQYHNVVRKLMLHYLSQRSITRYQTLHKLLADFYKRKLDELRIDNIEQLNSEHAQDIKVEYVYHQLMESPNKNWGNFINEFVLALKFNLEYAKKLIALIDQPTSLEDLDENKRKTVKLMTQELPIIIKGPRWNGIRLYDHLCESSFSDNSEVNAHLYFLRGEGFRIKRGDNEKAQKYLSKAIELDPASYLAITEVGELLIDQEKYDEAVAEFDRALKLAPTYHYAYERKGAVLLEQKKYEEAISSLNSAYDTHETCPSTLAYRGACYLELGKSKEALADLDRAIEIRPKFPWALIRRGETYLAIKQYDSAHEDFQKARQITDQSEHEILKNIGLVFLGKNDYSNAANKFIEAIKEQPACQHCWISLIESYERYQPAEMIPELLSETNFPEVEFTADVYLNRALSFSEKGYEESYDELALAFNLDPELKNSIEVDSNNGLGLAHSRNGHYEAAINCFKLDETASDFVAKYNIAIAMILWKGADVAITEIQRAEEALLKLKEDSPDETGIAIYGFAGLEAAKNNKEKALNLLKEAIIKAPGVYMYASKSDPAWKYLRVDPDIKDFLESHRQK